MDSLNKRNPCEIAEKNPYCSCYIATTLNLLEAEADFDIGWWHSVVVSVLASISVVNRHWARLVPGWVTVCRWVNHLCM